MPDDASSDLDRDEFIVQFLSDLARGESKTLEQYYQRYPGREDLVASEWRRLKHLAKDDGLTGAGARESGDAAAQAPEPPQPRGRATALGRYRIERELGSGTQGSVFQAWDTTVGRRVALKVLKASWSASSDMVRRFEIEAQALARLDHPGIASVFDAGSIRGLHYFAMRHVEGRTLAEEITGLAKAGERIDGSGVARYVALAEQAARALHSAHEAGLVHRDVKPGNLMISPEDAPVLLDFGIALLRGTDHALTATGDVLGTPAFMAPEQMAGERRRIDRRADVYGLAATLHEALTCGAARERSDPAAALRARPPARRLNPAVSRDLDAVLRAALERDPDRRYATAAAFADDLARVRLGQPVLVRPPSAWRGFVAWCHRAPAAATLILIAPIALAAGLGSLALKNREIERAAFDLDAKGAEADVASQVAKERFAEFRRLDDLRRVQDLEDRERDLWPPRPDRVPAMERWLKDAEELASRLPAHRSALLALRQRGVEAPRESGGDADPAVARLLDGRKMLQAVEAELASPEPTTRRRGHLQRFAGDARKQIAAREGELASRPVWRFEQVEDQWVHDNLALLVARLEALTGPSVHEGTIASVRRRADVASGIEAESLAKAAEEWRAAVAAIADPAADSPYGGLRVAPILGLVPIGRDPVSRLWEFAHVLSGTPPVRNASGALEITEESSIVLVLIPGGSVRIGARPPVDEMEAPGDHIDPVAVPIEGPPHDLVLDPFLISKYEMTQGQWLRATGRNPSHNHPGSNVSSSERPNLRHPVEQVSVEDCEDVLRRLGLVLPTEAQWEHAARARTTTPWWHGPTTESFLHDDNLADVTLGEKATIRLPYDPERNDGWLGTAPVGSFRANPFGLHDVIGNVLEICADEYDIYGAPVLPGDGLRCARNLGARPSRGGSFIHQAASARASYRTGVHPTERSPGRGVRPALAVNPP